MPVTDFLPGGGPLGLLPQRYDVEIYQGDTFEVILTFKDTNNVAIDLTGVTYECKFDKVSGGAAEISPTTTTLGTAVNGQVDILITDTSTLITGPYYWDLTLISGGKKRTYIGGIVTITNDIAPA